MSSVENKIPKTLPAKYLKHYAFLKWFQDNGSTLPDFNDIPATISFLNHFIDFESTHINHFKQFIKNHNNTIKQQNKDQILQDKITLKNNKLQWNLLKKSLKTDHNLRSYFINNHLNLLFNLLNPPPHSPSTTLHNLLKNQFPKFNSTTTNTTTTTNNTLLCFIKYNESLNQNNSSLKNEDYFKESKIVDTTTTKQKITNKNIPEGASDFVASIIENAEG